MSRHFGFVKEEGGKAAPPVPAAQKPLQLTRSHTLTRQTTAQPVSADLNATGATLVKIWDEICLKDDPTVRAIAAEMDKIVKGYSRGDTRLLPHWVETAKRLSNANMAVKGPALPAEFIMAPVVVAKGVTEKGTPVSPPAVVVKIINPEKPTEPAKEQEVAVLVDGTQTTPDGAMAAKEEAADGAPAPGTSVEGKGFSWGTALLVAVPVALWALS